MTLVGAPPEGSVVNGGGERSASFRQAFGNQSAAGVFGKQVWKLLSINSFIRAD